MAQSGWAAYIWRCDAQYRELNVKTAAYIALILTIGVASCAALGADVDRSLFGGDAAQDASQ